MNPFEGLRIFTSVCVLVICTYAFTRLHDGITAIDTVLRPQELGTRKMHVVSWFIAGLMLLIYATISALTPDNRPTSDILLISVNACVIVITLTIIVTALYVLDKWATVQGVLANKPLVPDDEDKKERAVAITRDMIHQTAGAFQLLVGVTDVLAADGSLTKKAREDILHSVHIAMLNSANAMSALHKSALELIDEE